MSLIQVYFCVLPRLAGWTRTEVKKNSVCFSFIFWNIFDWIFSKVEPTLRKRKSNRQTWYQIFLRIIKSYILSPFTITFFVSISIAQLLSLQYYIFWKNVDKNYVPKKMRKFFFRSVTVQRINILQSSMSIYGGLIDDMW